MNKINLIGNNCTWHPTANLMTNSWQVWIHMNIWLYKKFCMKNSWLNWGNNSMFRLKKLMNYRKRSRGLSHWILVRKLIIIIWPSQNITISILYSLVVKGEILMMIITTILEISIMTIIKSFRGRAWHLICNWVKVRQHLPYLCWVCKWETSRQSWWKNGWLVKSRIVNR